MRRLTIAAAVALSVIACPTPAHAEYTSPGQVGHGSGTFQVCPTPAGPGPYTYVITAADQRIIPAPVDSWVLGLVGGGTKRVPAHNGIATITTAKPLSGVVMDTVKVRKPGTNDTADLRFVATTQPACVTPTPDAHANTYTYPDGDLIMARITHPYPDSLDNLALYISDLRSLAAAVHNTYGEPDEADRIDAIADDLQKVLNRHRRGLVRRILGG